jgi:hypothetical protein
MDEEEALDHEFRELCELQPKKKQKVFQPPMNGDSRGSPSEAIKLNGVKSRVSRDHPEHERRISLEPSNPKLVLTIRDPSLGDRR